MQLLRRCVKSLSVAVLLSLPSHSPGQAGTPESPLMQSRALLQQGRAAEATALLKPYVAEHPEAAAGAYLLGYAYFALQQPRLSLEQYTRGAALREPTADDLLAVSADYILLSDYADAVKWLTKVTTLQPQNALAWYYLGRAQHLMGAYEPAAAAFNQALRCKPHYVRAEVGAGLVREAQGDDAGAMQAYQIAIAWQTGLPQPDAQPYLSAAELQLKQGQNGAALPLLELAAKFSHANPRVLEDVGRAYERMGKYTEAQTALEEAVHLAPRSSTVHFLLGTAYQRLGQKAKADQQFALTNGLLRTQSNQPTTNFDLQP